MAFQPAPNVAEFLINQRLFGEQVQNTLYAIRNPDWDAASLSNAVAAVASWFEDSIMPLRSTDLSLVGVDARALTTENAPFVSFPISPTVQGGVLSASASGSIAWVISFRTGLTGRSARGRNYCAGIAEADTAQNLVSEPFATGTVAAYELLPSIFGQFGAIHVVLSRQAAKVIRPAAFAFAITAYVAVDRNVDSQRRRLAGRGQ